MASPKSQKNYQSGLPMGIAQPGNPMQLSPNMGVGTQGGPLFSPTTPQFGMMPVGMLMQTRMQKIGVQRSPRSPRQMDFHGKKQADINQTNNMIPGRKKGTPQLF